MPFTSSPLHIVLYGTMGGQEGDTGWIAVDTVDADSSVTRKHTVEAYVLVCVCQQATSRCRHRESSHSSRKKHVYLLHKYNVYS